MLHADVHGPPGAPRVVLVHGFTQTRRSWDALLPRLAQHHEVVAVDAPAPRRRDQRSTPRRGSRVTA